MDSGKKMEVKQVNSENRLFQGVCCKTRNGEFLSALDRTDYIHTGKDTWAQVLVGFQMQWWQRLEVLF